MIKNWKMLTLDVYARKEAKRELFVSQLLLQICAEERIAMMTNCSQDIVLRLLGTVRLFLVYHFDEPNHLHNVLNGSGSKLSKAYVARAGDFGMLGRSSEHCAAAMCSCISRDLADLHSDVPRLRCHVCMLIMQCCHAGCKFHALRFVVHGVL